MKKRNILMLVAAAVLLSSCVVSKKKYEIAESGRLAALYSRDSLADLLGMARNDYAILDELKNSLEADTVRLKSSIRNYQALLATGQDENQKLSANLAKLNSDLTKKMEELQDREKTIAELQKKAKFYRVTAAGQREARPHDITITKEAPNYRT